jgi:trehalose 6-phosphate phosphatase
VSLEDLARTPRLLVALDFDGTLSPLVDEPMTARMTREAAEAIAALVAAPATTVALVSGRTLDDLRVIAEHDDGSALVLAGSHGAQWWFPRGTDAGRDAADEDDADAIALRDDLRREAERAAGDAEGAWIEEKKFGFAVHTRRATPEAAERLHARIAELVSARAPRWRRRTGHDLSEYAFRAEGKDSAVALLRERVRATGVLFAGDDVTDEDALRSLLPGDVGIRVGEGETAAGMRVRDIPELAAVLLRLAQQRATGCKSSERQ